MASLISKCALFLTFATMAFAQLSVPVSSAMQHWEQEVKYYGPERNASHILQVLGAFSRYYVKEGVEPPRSLFNNSYYHDTWNRLRMDLRHLYEAEELATSYDAEEKYWFSCGLVSLGTIKKAGMCVSLKALHFPEPCSDPVQLADRTWTCPGGASTTIQSEKPFCCHSWILDGDKCASCTDAESNGDQRNVCNLSRHNCDLCGGAILCPNSVPGSVSTNARMSALEVNGRTAVKSDEHGVPGEALVASLQTRRSARNAAERAALEDLETKSSIDFDVEEVPPPPTESEFVIEFYGVPSVTKSDEEACFERSRQYSSMLGPCRAVCWYVRHSMRVDRSVLNRYAHVF